MNEQPCRITVRTGSASEVPPPPTITHDPRRLDDEAGFWLAWGYHRRAELLSRQAAELREGR